MKHQKKKIGTKDLTVGKQYLHRNGSFVRTIEKIEGDTVTWSDQHGYGNCKKSAFLQACPYLAPDTSQDGDQAVRLEFEKRIGDAFKGGFTLRDEANALTAYAFRNTFLEDLHAGEHSELLENPKYSRITDSEMKQLMIEASGKMEALLKLKQEFPEKYSDSIKAYAYFYSRDWER